MNDRLLTKYEVMEILKISRKHFEKLVKEKELPMIQIIPYKRYVRSSHLNQYIGERTIIKPQEITQELEIDDFKWKNIWGINDKLNHYQITPIIYIDLTQNSFKLC